MDPKKPPHSPAPKSNDELASNAAVDDFFNRLHSDMHRPVPSPEAVSAAMQTMQRLAAESVADVTTNSTAPTRPCPACGHQNRPLSRFCGGCGVPLQYGEEPFASASTPTSAGEAALPPGQYHYHHHFHHHYFAPGQDVAASSSPRPVSTDAASAKFRTPGGGATPMSRVETAVRKVTLDWALACNSRQLEDLVSTYSPDALLLRPNHPAVRGTAGIREFFFHALDAGFGEVELDPLRVDIVGDVAYEAGRCKMLVPYVVGKRREERGKYLIVLARQPNGEWRIVSDCWSSDLSLPAGADAEVPKAPSAPVKPAPSRKGP